MKGSVWKLKKWHWTDLYTYMQVTVLRNLLETGFDAPNNIIVS